MTSSLAARPANRIAGAAAFAVAGLLDILMAVVSFTVDYDRPPTPVLIVLILVGLVSAAGLTASRGALIAVYVARFVSAGLGIPAFLLDAPGWVLVAVALGLVLTVAGIWLTAPALRRRIAAPSS